MAKYLFVVQGEGRGHLTQAISLYELLKSAGHEVVAVMVGKGDDRNLPSFFQEKVAAPIHTFSSPSLVYGNGKALRMWDTVKTHALRLPKYMDSIKQLADKVEETQPDVIINFYEMICGLYCQLYQPGIPCVCIAHQYLLLHKNFVSIDNKMFDRWLLNLNTRITALGSTKKMALSFVQMDDDTSANIVVTPPLLRDEVKSLTPQRKPFLLAYITHHKLSEDIINWHANHRDVEIHCFWNNQEFSDEWHFRENLTFHQVNAEKFLAMMQDCAGLVCTAGFESVCEAMYLGKPILMVPVPNHIEQEINALDGQRAGAGIADSSFNLSRFMEYLPVHKSVHETFKNWQAQTPTIFLNELEMLVSSKQQIFTFKPKSYSTMSYLRQLFLKTILK
jgi:uncharacterized protein (TIGR00661 family)